MVVLVLVFTLLVLVVISIVTIVIPACCLLLLCRPTVLYVDISTKPDLQVMDISIH